MKATYAVIFTSKRNSSEVQEYEHMSKRMLELVSQQKGFVSADSVRDADGNGITVSYWENLSGIKAWKQNVEHLEAQDRGKIVWYSSYSVKICKIEA